MIYILIPILEKLILGMFIGGCIGLTGVGGGVLIIPSLTLLFGMPTTVAVGTANLYAFLSKISGTFHHWKQNTIALKDSMFFLTGAIPANLITAYLITQYAIQVKSDLAAWENFQNNLHHFIAGLVIFSALLMVINIIKQHNNSFSLRATIQQYISVGDPRRMIAAIIMGIGTGGLIASTSVGGGVLIVPVLIIGFGLSSAQTVGSSILIAVVLSLLSAIVYASNSQLDYSTATIMAIGSLIGVPVGVRLSKRLPEASLQIIIAVIVMVAGLLMFL